MNTEHKKMPGMPENSKANSQNQSPDLNPFETCPDALVRISADGSITETNQAMAEITGLHPEDLIGALFCDQFADPVKMGRMAENIFTKGSADACLQLLKSKNDGLTNVLCNGSVYKDEAGKVAGAIFVIRDVECEDKTSYSRRLIEASLDPLVTISLDGKIMDFNEALENITGIIRESLTGSDFFTYFTDPQKAKEVYQQVFAEGSIADSPLTLQHTDGKLTDVLFNGSVFRDDHGAVIGAVVVARDIAEQKWATELRIVNKELAFQNNEKEKRAQELTIANIELAFQNDEKEKRSDELSIANKELAFQNEEKEKRAQELSVANTELAFQNDEKEKRAAELSVANTELAFQNDEKEKRAAELSVANKELAFQNDEKEKRAAELSIANKELAFQNDEKEKRAAELSVANKELAFQNDEKEKRAAELSVANKELAFQNDEKEKRSDELSLANKELAFQNDEKEKRAAELVIANIELDYQKAEKVKRAAELRVANYARGLIEASRDPLMTISPEGKITDMNQATSTIIGLERDTLIGSDFFNYFTEPQKAREVYQEVFDKGSIADLPLTLRRNDGNLTDVLFNGSVYKNDQGHVVGVVIVARDVTDQKRIATELLEAKIAAEHATVIAEEAKAKAEAATLVAKNAVKTKQQFLSNMSHEIRTPMNAIVGFTKVLQKTDLTEKQKEYVSAIKVSGDALIVLINDILDLAKVDAGKMTFEQTPFKLSASISSMLHLFETKIQEKNLELVKEYDNEIPEVLLGDPVRLHQIILNLVSNAVKFTTEGKITVSVRMLAQTEENVSIEFAVTDTGIGIKDHKLNHIFDDFQQATSGTSRLYGGTGLGLAIVKNLVEPQGGKIRVVSKVGEGSTFSFILDFAKTTEKAELETASEMELEAGFNNVKILVVEDIALNQLLMKTLLEEFGFAMDIACHGELAIEMLKDNTYDIILMDLQMPVMNGFDATEYIRNTMKLTVPIIALTADVTTVDVEKCKAVGMNDYISKPIDDKLLYSKIIKYLKVGDNAKKKPAAVTEDLQTQEIKFVNFDYLKRITKSNIRMSEMIALYLDEIPQLVQTMKSAIEKNDWESLKISTHSIIPTFATIGINPEFEDMAKAIQAIAANLIETETGKDASDETMLMLGTLYQKIETVCIQAAKELEEELILLKGMEV